MNRHLAHIKLFMETACFSMVKRHNSITIMCVPRREAGYFNSPTVQYGSITKLSVRRLLKFLCLYVLLVFAISHSLLVSAQIAEAAPSAQAAVASAHPLATQAGIHILNQGGNAFDAAVAVTSTLAVVEPYSSGLGGGGFWLLHQAETGRDSMLDGRERAPLRASRNMYLDKQGKVIPGASMTGPLASGIPGVPAALVYLAKKYGKLPLAQTLAPAIRLARKGFRVDAYYQRMARFRLADLRRFKNTRRIFLKQGKVPEIGTLIKQPALAATLEKIVKQGKDGFYTGKTAWNMVKSVRHHGGIWTLKDLATYKVIERSPAVAYYKGMKLVTASLPSSGGLVLTEMLHILAKFDIESASPVQRVHLLVEAMRMAYRDRAEYMGDPDYVDVPEDYLRSEKHTMEMVHRISASHATPSSQLKQLAAPTGAGTDTTHFSIVDKSGNRVAATLSINYPFGSCFVAGDSGVLLNDEMDDFSAKPGVPNVYGLVGTQANAIAPGKRMLSSMSPSFAETRDRIAVVGTPGGSRIITMVLRAVLDFYRGASAQQMVALGRYHHQYLPDKIFYEPGVFDKKLQTALKKMGYVLQKLDSTYGNMQVVVVNKKTGKVEAAADKRGIGRAMVLP